MKKSIKQLIESIVERRIVTRPSGSWKWQQAYGISYYTAKERESDGALIYNLVNSVGKYSRPQLRRAGLDCYKDGSAQGEVVAMLDAAGNIGWDDVQYLLDHGYSFAC